MVFSGEEVDCRFVLEVYKRIASTREIMGFDDAIFNRKNYLLSSQAYF